METTDISPLEMLQAAAEAAEITTDEAAHNIVAALHATESGGSG